MGLAVEGGHASGVWRPSFDWKAAGACRCKGTPPLDGTVAAPNYLAAHQPPLTFDFGGRSLVGPCIVREDDRQRRAL